MTKNIKEYINLNNAQIILSGLCLFFVLDKLTNFGIETYVNYVEFSNALNFGIKVFQNIIFCFLFLNLFFKFNFSLIGFVAPISYFEQNNNWFYGLHNFLINNNFYNLFTNQSYNVSPEYPRIIVFLIILILYFILLFNKNFRNFKRIFVFLGAAGTFVTAIIFHTVIIEEIKSYKSSQEDMLSSARPLLQSGSDFNLICKSNNLTCVYYELNDEELFFQDKNMPNYMNSYLEYFKNNIVSQKEFFVYLTAIDPVAKNRIMGQKPFAMVKNDKFVALIIDEFNYKMFLAKNQYLFALLSLSSHFVWFFGSLFLIFFHSRRKKLS